MNTLPILFKVLDKDFNAPKTSEIAAMLSKSLVIKIIILEPGKFTDNTKAYFDKLEEFQIALFNSLPSQEWYSKLNEAIMDSYLAYQSNVDFTVNLSYQMIPRTHSAECME